MKSPLIFVSILVALTMPVATGAQETAAPTITRGQGADFLTDGSGQSLYIYLRDSQGESACYDVCAENWPPLIVEGEASAGEGLTASMLGTVEREDGSSQLTYNGWPLYHYAYDEEPGQAYGHTLGDVFYLVGGSGGRVTSMDVETDIAQAYDEDEESQDEGGETATAAEAGEAEAVDVADGPGADLYASNCAACHGNEGEGQVGPGLAGNPAMERANYIVSTILFGRPDHGMPAFGDQLTDGEIAAIATFVRGSWGNDYPAVDAGDVEDQR